MSNTTGGRNSNAVITKIVFTGVMAAIICVITTFRIPLGQSKVHFANSMCLLSGLLLGPAWGGTAAGLGSAIYDVLLGGYSFFDALITFVSKFAMAWVTGILYKTWVLKKEEKSWKENLLPLILSCVLGALKEARSRPIPGRSHRSRCGDGVPRSLPHRAIRYCVPP